MCIDRALKVKANVDTNGHHASLKLAHHVNFQVHTGQNIFDVFGKLMKNNVEHLKLNEFTKNFSTTIS